jgi:hypothetical protein
MSKFFVRGDLENLGWVVRFSNLCGDAPIGPRLAKGTSYPQDIGVFFEKKCGAQSACEKWNTWYHSQPYLMKKRKAKYVS